MNNIVLVGRTTRDPELKFGQSGKAFCKFTLAVNRAYKKDEVDFINCTAFNKTAELIGEYIRKGNKCGVQGTLQMQRYEKDGEKRTSYEVIVNQIEFLENNKNNSNENNERYTSQKQTSSAQIDDDPNSDDSFPF